LDNERIINGKRLALEIGQSSLKSILIVVQYPLNIHSLRVSNQFPMSFHTLSIILLSTHAIQALPINDSNHNNEKTSNEINPILK
jgi:hypothetical protein